MSFGSDVARSEILDLTLGPTQAPEIPDPYWVALFTGDPRAGGTELPFTSGYARVAIPKGSWGLAVGGVKATAASVTFPVATGNWPAASWIGFYDLSAGGVLYDVAPLSAPATVQSSGTLVFKPGTITVTQT